MLTSTKITKSITPRDEKSFKKYLNEIESITLLSQEEEVELAVKIRNGDKKALDKLVKANLRFVVSVAKQYQHRGLLLPDLVNEGNIGLIKAAQRFDETRGFKFISYAVSWIKQAILQAIVEQGRIVRLPLHVITAKNKSYKAKIRFEQQFEREPTADELAEIIGEKKSKINFVKQIGGSHVSLDEESIFGDVTMGETLECDEKSDKELQYASLKEELKRTLNLLPPKQYRVISSFFGIVDGESKTLKQIADTYNMTAENARQVRDKAIGLLRSCPNHNLLKAYLG